MLDLKNYRESMASTFGTQYLTDKERYIKIEIGDIPVLRSDDKKLVCLAKERIENLKIGIFGQTGAGRTSLLLSIMSRMYWSNWNMDCCIINDYQGETDRWGLDNWSSERELRQFGEIPFPLPIVDVYPQNKDTPSFKEMSQCLSVPHIRESIPFNKIVEDITKYVKMGKNTERYWLTLRDKLKTCQDLDEVREKIKELGFGEKGVNLKASIFSMLTSVDELEKEGYIDIVANNQKFDHSGTPSCKIKIKSEDGTSEEGSIFSMLMKYHYVPILRTEDLLHLRYAEPYLADKTEEIFNYPKFMNYTRRCMTFVPEISKFIDFPEVLKKIEDITGRGRAKGVGICYDTHSYKELRNANKGKIIQNTVFAIAFNQKAETATLMKNDFDLDEKDKDQIINLKQFQCLAIASKGEKFAIYNLNDGTRELVGGKVYRGYALPSLCQHQKGNIK
jgi:hypothetical protein